MFKSNKFFFKTNKLLHSYMIKDIICLLQGRNLFDLKTFLFGLKIFCLNQTNHFSKSKKVFQTNDFLWFNLIFFLSVEKCIFYMISASPKQFNKAGFRICLYAEISWLGPGRERNAETDLAQLGKLKIRKIPWQFAIIRVL